MATTFPLIDQPVMQVTPPPQEPYRIDVANAQPAQGAPEQDTNGFETWADYRMMALGGRKMTSRDGKAGWVFSNGRSEGEMRKLALDEWNGMGDSQRQQALAKAKPARIGEGGVQPPQQTEALRYQSQTNNAPMTRPNMKGGVNIHANETFNAMGDAEAARLASARSAVQNVKAQQDAANGIVRTASGSVVTAGGGVITPTGPGGATAPKVLASPYGSGSSTNAQPGQPRPAGVFYGTNKGDSTPMTLAQATGKEAPFTGSVGIQAGLTAALPHGHVGASAGLTAPKLKGTVGAVPSLNAGTPIGKPEAGVSAGVNTGAPPVMMTPLDQATSAVKTAAKTALVAPVLAAKTAIAASPIAQIPKAVQTVGKAVKQAQSWLTTPRAVR